jgi:tRNA(Ile)-lysidine synthase
MPLGALCLDRQALRQAPEGASAFLARALLCVGGTQKTVRGDSLARLEAQLRAETEFAATLSGVKVSANDRSVWLVREGPRSGQALNTILQDQVWDGRFEVHGLGEGARLALLKGYAKALSPSERAWLVALPAQLRQSLPVVLTPGKAPSLPQFVGGPELTETNGVLVRSLVRPRLMAACGQIRTEKDLMI